ncbi:MAG: translation initiation factor IF-6 [Thermoprotei archaeon]|nr:MAG: translation initiation factor IF-6 [Thermoprotei archaeon]
MSVQKSLLYGNPNVGVYAFTNENITILPVDVPEKNVEEFAEALGTEVFLASICESPLLGVFIAGNSNGILLPRFSLEYEVEKIKEKVGDKVNVEVLSSLRNALGNLILANDKVAIVSPLIEKEYLKMIEEVLDVEVVVRTIGGSPLVGSIASISNRGLLVYPLVTDEELEELRKLFNITVDVGTVNRGSIFLRAGLVVNSKGAIVGYETTGPELLRIHQVFFGKE